MLLTHEAASAFPLAKYDFPIEQAFEFDGVRPRALWPEKLEARSQDLPDHYHDAGLLYWFDAEKFLAEGRLFSVDSVAFVIACDQCQDINTPEDWDRATIKFCAIAGREAP
jgi:N-acylneuraminate cytidylyltransferase